MTFPTTATRTVPGAEPRFDDEGREIVELAECGTCGAVWNDAAVSSVTPAPAGRCPFESDHEREPEADNELEHIVVRVTRSAAGVALILIDTDGFPEGPNGPLLRIMLNDGYVFQGAPYNDEAEWTALEAIEAARDDR